MPSGPGSDITQHFRASWEVLVRHPVLLVPPVMAAGALLGLILVLFGGAAVATAVGGVAGGLLGAVGAVLIFAPLAGLVSLVASAVVVVMARDALDRREPDLGAALGAVMARIGDVVIASIVAMLAVGVGMLLLVVPGLVAALFLVFTLPAVLLDGDPALAALRRSVALVRDNLGTAVGLAVGWIVVAVVVGIVSRILELVPVVGWLASGLLFGAAVAYLTLVVVRVHQELPRR